MSDSFAELRASGPIDLAIMSIGASEGFREPIERFQAALHETPERIALREIGETFVLS